MLGGGCGCVDGDYSGYLSVLREKRYCVGVALDPGVGHIGAITAIMVHCRAEVPPIYAVVYPRRAFVFFLCTTTFVPGGARGVLL